MTRWPAFIKQRFLNNLGEQTAAKQAQYSCREFEIANRISRVMLTQLINSFREVQRHAGFKLSSPINRNLVHLTLQVEELILSSHQKVIETDQSNGDATADVNESFFRWIQRDYLFYQNGSGSSFQQNLWAEWDLVESLLMQVDPLFHESYFGVERVSDASADFD